MKNEIQPPYQTTILSAAFIIACGLVLNGFLAKPPKAQTQPQATGRYQFIEPSLQHGTTWVLDTQTGEVVTRTAAPEPKLRER